MLGQAVNGQTSSASADSGFSQMAQSLFNSSYGSGFGVGYGG